MKWRSGILVAVLVAVRIAMAGHHHAAVADPAPPPSQPAALASGTDSAGPWSVAGASAPTGPTVLVRDATGQFRLTARVNGHEAQFLVDTGADLVSLTPEAAMQLGIAVDPATYQPVMRTASGTAMGARVRIGQLEVAGATLSDVDAVVVQGLGVNLLGQSALARLGSVALHGDRMELAAR